MTQTETILTALLFAVAVLYSSVGHAGASGYVAMMALLGLAPEQVRPTALALNILVGGIGLVRYARAGHVRWRSVWPLVLASAPAAFLAAQVKLPKDWYEALLGVLLLCAAVALASRAHRAARDDAQVEPREIRWPPALLTGGTIGVLSGLTGTGGAIFLTPLLLFRHWARTRDASGISVAFVWINSVVGLAGNLLAGARLPQALPAWLGAVALGALLGTQLGIRWLPVTALRYALALVLVVAAGKLLFA